MTVDTNEWWAGIGGQAVGPLSPADLRARWEAGEVTASTLVWREGFAEWRPAGDVPEIAGLRQRAGTWQPAAGSALAALAGAELASLRGTPPPAPSGSTRLDAFTGASGAPRNEALAIGATPAPDAAPALPVTAAPSAASAAGAQGASSSTRRIAVASAVGTFAMGAAVAVALLLVFRGGDRGHAPVSAAPAATARSDEPRPAQPAVAAKPAATTDAAPAAPPPEATPSVGVQAPRPAVARNAVASAEPVRASDPPATPPAKTSKARATPRNAHPEPRHVARAKPPAPKSVEKKPTPAAAASNDPLAMAGTPGAPQQSRSSSRDPLADLVSDADLDRELGGAPAKDPARNGGTPASSAPAAAAKTTSDAAPPSSGKAAVYVPPAPGGDLPEGVTPVQINEAVKARMSALRACIDEQRAADPASKGTLKMRWVIGGDGSVRDLRNLSSEYEGKPIARCIGGVVREIRFPTSRTSGQEVVFPFKF